MNPFQVFIDSWLGKNLSPGTRAFLKLFEGWLFTGLVIGIGILYQLLMSGSSDYVYMLRSAGVAVIVAVLTAMKKYFAAQTDLPLPVASLAGQVTDVALMEAQKIAPGPGEHPSDTPPPGFVTPIPYPPPGMQPVQPPAPMQPAFAYTPQPPQQAFPPLERHWTGMALPAMPPQQPGQ